MDVNRSLDDFDPDFKYTHANASHSWLMNYPGSLKPAEISLKMSSMKETFQEPDLHRKWVRGKRKKLLEAFFRQVISEEVFGQLDSEEIIIEEYATDYTDHFKNPDDMPLPGEICSKNEKLKKLGIIQPDELSKKSKMEELKTKYPLYLSAPLTYFSHTTGRECFRKNSTITKSPEKNYDNI